MASARARDTRASLKNYIIQIKAPLAQENEFVFAFVTESMDLPVFGEKAIAELGLSTEGSSTVSLISDDKQYPLSLEVTLVQSTATPTVNEHYMQIGWKAIERDFKIGKEKHDVRIIEAKVDRCVDYHSVTRSLSKYSRNPQEVVSLSITTPQPMVGKRNTRTDS